ncbi:MAG: ornithine carbamoyltransferase [Candidatus Omnitrophica bacterium]|nr:ornithine carbamoyltransferase [Candidatus Omnitrophota bacterium]
MKRHFLTIPDLSDSQLKHLLSEAQRCKRQRSYGKNALAGKVVALVFQKPSMRTRVAFEVAVLQLGGSVVYLGQEDIQLGQREPIRDVARALSRYVDAIVVRTFAHEDAQEFARFATVSVINGLSDQVHPCQAVADMLTLQEHFGRLKGLPIAYVGDGNNVLHSLAQACAMLGVHLSVATPAAYRPNGSLWEDAVRLAAKHQAKLSWHSDPKKMVRGACVIYTDVWVSMGQEKERKERLKTFRPYQVNQSLLSFAHPQCRIMHCLPAHRFEEISEDVMESRRSLIFDQAENRLHAQKALLLMLLGRKNG